jgi:hypothetical protein
MTTPSFKKAVADAVGRAAKSQKTYYVEPSYLGYSVKRGKPEGPCVMAEPGKSPVSVNWAVLGMDVSSTN